MTPISFPGSVEIRKPDNMTDEQCMSVWAMRGFDKLHQLCKLAGAGIVIDVYAGVDTQNYPFFLTAWKPSYEDLQSLNNGGAVYIKTLTKALPAMAVFTIDENGNCNDPG